MADEITDLEGATQLPAPETMTLTAGEFAARWNARKPEDRELFVVRVRDLSERGRKCFEADHESYIEHLEKQVADLKRGRPL